MNPFRRSFLKLLATGGAVAASTPALTRADRIRVLPDGGADAIAKLVPGQRSPGLGRAMDGLFLGPAAVQGGLAVLWLHAKSTPGGPPLEILTLDEGRARGALTVVERAQASVPELIAENRGKAHVLLLAGEILVGGKQNRVLREDLLLPPLSGPRNIAVYCVEQGRWNEGRKDFDSRGSVVQPSVRSQVLRKAEQSRIWSRVASAQREMAAPSATGSYQAIYDKPEVKAQLEHTTRSFDPTVAPSAVGATVFVGPNLAGVDCFHAPGLFAREWPKLLRAYALDAYGTAAGGWDEAAARSRADGLLRAAGRIEGSERASVGAGGLFEFAIDGRRGAALVFEGRAIHVAIL
jgi:ARG/rhodanese/phosphatase superfamily protein